MILNNYLPNVICDKCGEKRIIQTTESPSQPEPQDVKMSEYQGLSMNTNLIYRYTTYHLRCDNCGNTKTYTQ